MLFQDIRFFYGWLSNRNSQLKMDFISLVYMVPIDAHSVSATMKITTICSLNAPILKRSGGMFVTDATFQEWQKAGMNGFDGPLSLGMAKVLSIFLVNWVSQLQCIMSGKNGMQGSLQECLDLRIWSLIKSNVSFTISLIWWGKSYQQMKTKGSKELGGLIT
jgi:hypothetical protein